MTKADLKTGMRVTFRNNTFCKGTAVVLLGTEQGDRIRSLDGKSCNSFNEYRDNLLRSDSDFDIMKVYSAPDSFFNDGKGKLLWERHESEEMIDLDEMGKVSKSTIKEVLKRKFSGE